MLLFYQLIRKTYLYSIAWGAGVALSDTEYIRRKFDPASTIVIFFNNGKHNYLLQQAFTDITLRYINISGNPDQSQKSKFMFK